MKEYAETLREIEQQIYARAGKNFNISSAQQLGEVLDELSEEDHINYLIVKELLTEYRRYAQLNEDCA